MGKEFAITLAQTVAIELIGILGIFFLLGFILSKLQKATHKHYTDTIGWKGILLTAWLGTPVHEVGHIFFAKLFRHKITEVSLFDPNESTGGLGHVGHTYNRRSLYQHIGNFFIGAAPMIFGAGVLVIMLYFLVPNGKEVFMPLNVEQDSPFIAAKAIGTSLLSLLSLENLRSWEFWVFIYMSFCISSHMAPSKQDRKGMWKGFASMVIVLTLFNIIPVLLGIDLIQFIGTIYGSMTIVVAIFLYALIISTLHYILASILFMIPRALLRR